MSPDSCCCFCLNIFQQRERPQTHPPDVAASTPQSAAIVHGNLAENSWTPKTGWLHSYVQLVLWNGPELQWWVESGRRLPIPLFLSDIYGSCVSSPQNLKKPEHFKLPHIDQVSKSINHKNESLFHPVLRAYIFIYSIKRKTYPNYKGWKIFLEHLHAYFDNYVNLFDNLWSEPFKNDSMQLYFLLQMGNVLLVPPVGVTSLVKLCILKQHLARILDNQLQITACLQEMVGSLMHSKHHLKFNQFQASTYTHTQRLKIYYLSTSSFQ